MVPYGIGTYELLVAKLGLVLSVCLPSAWSTVSEGCHLMHFVSMRNAPEEGSSRNTGLFMPEHCFCQALAVTFICSLTSPALSVLSPQA